MEEWLFGRGELWPEFVGTVDDGAGTECRECAAANGKSPGFKVVAASMQTKYAACAKFGERHLSECGDCVFAANGAGGAADAGFGKDTEQRDDGGAVRIGCTEDELIEVLQAGFAGPWSERRAGPVAEPVCGGQERAGGRCLNWSCRGQRRRLGERGAAGRKCCGCRLVCRAASRGDGISGDAVPGDPAGMTLYEYIREASLLVRSDHERDDGAWGIVEMVVNELADVTAGSAAEDDDACGQNEQEAVCEWDCAAEILPCVWRGTGDDG